MSSLKFIHKIAAICAFLLIVTFFSSTVIADLWGSEETIVQVKQLILFAVPLLVLAMMATGITANKIYRAKPKGIFAAKQTRMKIAAANGLIILIPAACFLALWSGRGQFDQVYWVVQAVELIAGFTNAVLMGLNIRDGIRLAKKRPAKSAI